MVKYRIVLSCEKSTGHTLSSFNLQTYIGWVGLVRVRISGSDPVITLIKPMTRVSLCFMCVCVCRCELVYVRALISYITQCHVGRNAAQQLSAWRLVVLLLTKEMHKNRLCQLQCFCPELNNFDADESFF